MNFKAFLSFGLAGTVVGLIIRLLPIHVPYMDAGLPFFVGWWVGAAIGRYKWVFLGTLVGILMLAGAAIALQAGDTVIPLRDIIRTADRRVGDQDAVIATINGEAVTWRELERVKVAIRATASSPLPEEEAYHQALAYLLRNRVLLQEARRRGLTVTDQEAESCWAQMKEQARQMPALAQMHAEQQAALGLDDQAYEAKMIAVCGEGLLLTKLDEALASEAPQPTEAEIDAYLAQFPGLNRIELIPIFFPGMESAANTYQELKALATTTSPEAFTSTFDEYARRLGQRGPEERIVEGFSFKDESVLPDYVQDALKKPIGAMGLYQRADGSAVIYLVLHMERITDEEVRTLARKELANEKRRTYQEQIERQLLRQAQIEFYQDRLPPEARQAIQALLQDMNFE